MPEILLASMILATGLVGAIALLRCTFASPRVHRLLTGEIAVVTAGRDVTFYPQAMEYERRYDFTFMRNPWCVARHRDESVEIFRERPR